MQFTPRSLSSGLVLNLDAMRRETITLSGAVVTGWADVSGQANNAAAGSGSPAYAASQINSRPGIVFTNDSLIIPNHASLSPTGGYSIICVCQSDADNGATTRVLSRWATNQLEYIFALNRNTDKPEFNTSANGTSLGTTYSPGKTLTTSVPVIMGLRYTGSVVTTMVNGSYPVQATTTISDGAGDLTLGFGSGSGNISIGQILQWSTDIGLNNFLKVIAAMSAKWNIPLLSTS